MGLIVNRIARSTSILAAILAVGIAGLGAGHQGSMAADEGPATPQDKQPEAVSVRDVVLLDLDGKELPLSKFDDKPIIMEMWATWCAPCVKQRKIIDTVAKELSEHVHLIGASVDDSPEKVKAFLKNNPTPEGMVEALATKALRDAIKPKDKQHTIPKMIFISSRGTVLDIAYDQQSAEWLLARAKSLK